jgi:hypothetical protein
VTYCIYAIFAAKQKFCISHVQGRSIGFHLLLGYFAFFTSLFGIGFLIFYGVRTTWWSPIVLFAIGVLIYRPFSSLEQMTDMFMPLTRWGLLSFVAIPICAVLLIYFTPRP